MKTPEEIKKRLERCEDTTHCNTCESSFHCQNEEDALAYIKQLEEREWELLNQLSSAWHGKQYYFKQEDGTVYSRESCQYMTFNQAIDEFAQSLTVESKNNKLQYGTGFINGFIANQPKWISVYDTLPKHKMKCIVHSKNGRTFTTWYDPEIYRFFPHFAKHNITHWIPLPEPPKED